MVTYEDMDDAYFGRGRFEGDGRATILADMAADALNRHHYYEMLARNAKRTRKYASQWVGASQRYYNAYRMLCTAVSVCVDPKHYSSRDDNVMRFVNWVLWHKCQEEDECREED